MAKRSTGGGRQNIILIGVVIVVAIFFGFMYMRATNAMQTARAAAQEGDCDTVQSSSQVILNSPGMFQFGQKDAARDLSNRCEIFERAAASSSAYGALDLYIDVVRGGVQRR